MSEIASSYLDVWQRKKTIHPDTRRALEKALGPVREAAKVKVEPGRCWEPEHLQRGGRVWGFAVQLYGLRSRRNWGIGDFTDLRFLVELAARLGASVVGVNPLHAGGISPYSPSSRHALNPLYVDVESVPEFQKLDLKPDLEGVRAADLVDYGAVGKIKYEAFAKCFAALEERRDRFEEFQRGMSRGLRDYTRFEAKRTGTSPELHAYIQWNARLQLEAAQRRARELGMPIGLYLDLALGADGGGAEAWSDRSVFAQGVSIGAPPDEFNPRGQDWGLPPYSPRSLRAVGYRPFKDLLRANMLPGGALRMDHVMALSRLYWIPHGSKADRGGYVSYPFEELLAILAAESRQRQCMVIGEDLGTVPAELRAALNAAGVLSYRPLMFEKDAPADAYPRDALVCLSTHDLPTWRGYWEGHDLKWRERLGLTKDFKKELAQRKKDQALLRKALGDDISAANAHALLARTPSKIVVIQPEDVFEVLEQANLPGSIDEHPNWRRKLPLELEQWEADPRLQRLAADMAERSFRRDPSFPAHLPVATYRLQFHKDFRFADALKIVPYLAELGVSHVYASPVFKARPGSNHGYDVLDQRVINPEIGTEEELFTLIRTLRSKGMGLVLDIVPNHMGVLQGGNPWWEDILEKGRASPYAHFFDIDWSRGRLLLPVLGKHYGEALEDGEIRLVKEGGKWKIAYYDFRFPLNRKTHVKPTKDPLTLHRILERQYYRLSYWRVASDEINYRRFFEITDLAALRTEDPEVFEATHVLVRKLARTPGVHGLRIDHPDGLADPERYLERLSQLGDRPWVVVEKILADHESMREEWKAHGTTGYRFANVLTGLFVDTSAESRFDRIYQRFTRERRSFEDIAYESRMLIMGTTLAAELNMLAGRLARIAAGNRRTRDYTASGLKSALAEIAARFPVYRTYVTSRGLTDVDRRYIDWAVRAARRASRVADPSVFEFVRSVLTLEAAPPSGVRRSAMVEFVTRFQQFTAPVVAKGIEDTAFYRYNRLVALNEVGNDPRNFGFSLKAFHAASEDRVQRWPCTMLASSTHDTKRSEDARARLAVLSEMPSAWRLALRRWSTMNRSRRTEIDGESLPSPADEYHYYQALVAIWPGASLKDLSERLKAYMLKAARESKLRTSWINPDTEYEAALERFVVESLRNQVFLKDLGEVMPRLVHLGMLVSLSQALVKVASPGVPDYYQGCELWDFSLVDPDNRRPVDFALRKKLLGNERDLLANLADGRAKLHVIRKGLEVRRRFHDLFHGGRYEPLHADGGREDNLVSFILRNDSRVVVAIAPRLFVRLMRDEDIAPVGEHVWGESRLELPAGSYTDAMTGRKVSGGPQRVAELLSGFPVALLVT
ncbi:MAG TPA: malto-oligosyltrehalose synthase [Burkholderiales bacterium]|nr:malto-oligosyltrehalose synthase [Burkholderiales bacterium]